LTWNNPQRKPDSGINRIENQAGNRAGLSFRWVNGKQNIQHETQRGKRFQAIFQDQQFWYTHSGRRIAGEMAEWLKAHAWKACLPQGNVGSNPTLSAIIESITYVEHRSVSDSKACALPTQQTLSGFFSYRNRFDHAYFPLVSLGARRSCRKSDFLSTDEYCSTTSHLSGFISSELERHRPIRSSQTDPLSEE
jgi:hypothetical protein